MSAARRRGIGASSLVTRTSSGHASVVLHPDDEGPTVTVGEAHHGFDEFGVVEGLAFLSLELDAEVLAAGDQRTDVGGRR
jgi:hypothetical protein